MLGLIGEIRRRLMLADIFRSIKKEGWTGTYVPGDESGGSFAYSVGFPDAVAAPEIIIFGAGPEDANGLLYEAFLQLKAGTLVLADKAPWIVQDGLPPLAWRKVHQSQIRREHFNIAIIQAERQGRSRADIQAYQLLFPDKNGRFPWEDGYDLSYEPKQPELYLPYVGPPEE